MPHLFISFNEAGVVERIQIAHKPSATGRPAVAYEHRNEDGTVADFPHQVELVVAWAQERLATARTAAVGDTLAELAGVPADKLADVMAAIAEERSKPVRDRGPR